MKTLGLQVYTIREVLKDAEFMDLAFKKLAAMGITELQTAGDFIVEPAEYARLAHKYGMSVVGTHYDYNKILNAPEETIAVHRALGTTNIGIGGMPRYARSELDELKKFVEEFNRTAELYAKEGFKLTYHNHQFEFMRIDGTKTLMDILADELDKNNVSFVLDTCWVAAGGNDVRYWIEKLAGRVDILHLKDIRLDNRSGNYCGTMTEIGNGSIYWDGVIETARKTGVQSYVIEQDANFINGNPFESLQVSTDYLKNYL
mgnify:CR=1 FL=1